MSQVEDFAEWFHKGRDGMPKAMRDQHDRIALTLITTGKTQVRPHMRPHTYVFVADENGTKVSESTFVGIVFHEWPSHFTNLRFKLELDEGDYVVSGQFCSAHSRNKKMQYRGLVIPERWCWMTMVKKYKGLSAGNL